MPPKSEPSSAALRFDALPSPWHELPADPALAEGLEALAALARRRTEDAAEHDAIWRSPPPAFSRASPRQKRALERIARNREIMRLAARGWSNDLIGRRVKLHPVTISKIIQRTLRGEG